MRTTLTIQDDILLDAKAEASRSGRTLSQVVTAALRASVRPGAQFQFAPSTAIGGLAGDHGVSVTRGFPVSEADGALKPGLSYDRVAELLDFLDEDDAHP